jgi:hypothetical protein
MTEPVTNESIYRHLLERIVPTLEGDLLKEAERVLKDRAKERHWSAVELAQELESCKRCCCEPDLVTQKYTRHFIAGHEVKYCAFDFGKNSLTVTFERKRILFHVSFHNVGGSCGTGPVFFIFRSSSPKHNYSSLYHDNIIAIAQTFLARALSDWHQGHLTK